jgi:hypothetical protein
MPGSTNVIITAGSGSFYAIDNGTFPDTVTCTTADIQAALRNIMFWIKSASLEANPALTDVEVNTKSIHWLDIKNILLPEANNFINDILKVRYYVPFKKTETSGTEYDKHIVQMASLYCAWRVETRSFPGGGMPSDSPYAQTLRQMLNERLNEILQGSVRLLGQRLKAGNRFINPNIEEVPAGLKQGMDQVTQAPDSVQTSYRTRE